MVLRIPVRLPTLLRRHLPRRLILFFSPLPDSFTRAPPATPSASKFAPLVQILAKHRSRGCNRSHWLAVANEMTSRYPGSYGTSFRGYLTEAEQQAMFDLATRLSRGRSGWSLSWCVFFSPPSLLARPLLPFALSTVCLVPLTTVRRQRCIARTRRYARCARCARCARNESVFFISSGLTDTLTD